MQSLQGKVTGHGTQGTQDPATGTRESTTGPSTGTEMGPTTGTTYGTHPHGTQGAYGTAAKTTFAPELNDVYSSLNSLHGDIKNYSGDLDGLNALQRKLNAIENKRNHGAFGWKGEAQTLPQGQADLHRMLHLCYQEIRNKLNALGHREELDIHPKLMYIKNDLDNCMNFLNSCRSVTGDDQSNLYKLRDVYRCQGILYHIESKRMNGMFVPPECLAYTPVEGVPEAEVKGSFDPTKSKPADAPMATKQKETLTLPVDVIRGQSVLHDQLFECWELSYRMADDLENRFTRSYYGFGGPTAASTAVPSTATQYAEKGERFGPTGKVTELPGLIGGTHIPTGLNIRELVVGNVSVCDLGLLANQLRDAIAALRDVRPQVVERPVPVPSEPRIIEKTVTVPSEPKIIEKPVVVPSEPQIIEKPVIIEKEASPKEVTIPQPEIRTRMVTVPAQEAERIQAETARVTAAVAGTAAGAVQEGVTGKMAPAEVGTTEWAKRQQGTSGAA